MKLLEIIASKADYDISYYWKLIKCLIGTVRYTILELRKIKSGSKRFLKVNFVTKGNL